MLGVLVSLAFAGAGVAAIGAIGFTIRSQAPAVARLLQDSRSLAKDREFLVRITGEAKSPLPFASPRFGIAQLRRLPHRAVRRPAAEVKVAQPLRAAA